MAGEARKAAERLSSKKFNESVNRHHVSELARVKRETIEQCAKIADKAQAKSEEEVREFRRLKLSGCAMQSQSEMSAFRTVAAAIRSIAQQDSANEGE